MPLKPEICLGSNCLDVQYNVRIAVSNVFYFEKQALICSLVKVFILKFITAEVRNMAWSELNNLSSGLQSELCSLQNENNNGYSL